MVKDRYAAGHQQALDPRLRILARMMAQVHLPSGPDGLAGEDVLDEDSG